jgi:hypothetical protein
MMLIGFAGLGVAGYRRARRPRTAVWVVNPLARRGYRGLGHLQRSPRHAPGVGCGGLPSPS